MYNAQLMGCNEGIQHMYNPHTAGYHSKHVPHVNLMVL